MIFLYKDRYTYLLINVRYLGCREDHTVITTEPLQVLKIEPSNPTMLHSHNIDIVVPLNVPNEKDLVKNADTP